MKKQLLLVGLFCVSIMSMNAQNMDYRSTISVNAGLNAISLFPGLVNSASDETGVKLSATPSFQVSYDFALAKWFSLGAAGSFNTVKSTGTGFSYTDTETGKTGVGNYDYKGTRMTFAVRALFHYGNSDKLDMYSGLRVGIKRWNNTLTATGTLKDVLTPNGVWPSLNGLNAQVIPFGLRYYVTNNLGLGFETAFGAPYFAALQVNYRLGGKN
jgi:hypothetical protein